MAPNTAIRSRSVGLLTRFCFRNAVASKGGDLFLAFLWLQGPYPGSHGVGICLCYTDDIPVEARGHSIPPPHLPEGGGHSIPPRLPWRSGLRLGLCALYARARSSRGIYHFSMFDGGGIFSTASAFRGGWSNACAIEVRPLSTERLRL